MSEVTGPTVVFGVKSFPDLLAPFEENAVLVAMTPRLSVTPLPPSTELFTPTDFVTINVHHSLQDELDTLWSSAESQSKENSISNHKHEFGVLFSSLLLWRWLIRHTLQTLTPRHLMIPAQCVATTRTVASREEIWEWTLYQLLEEETRHIARDYFTEVNGSPLTGNNRSSYSLIVHNFADFTARVIRQVREFLLFKSLSLKFTDFRTRLTWWERLLGALRRSRGHQVQNVLVIGQLNKVRMILKYRSSGVRMGYLSYSQFEKIVYPKNRQKSLGISPSPGHSAQVALLSYFQSEVARSNDSQEALGHLLNGNWSTLVTDGQHHPEIRSLIDLGIEAGKSVAIVPEGAISYVGIQERFGPVNFHDNPLAMRFVLDEAQREYWRRAGTLDGNINVSGYFGGDSPSTRRQRSVESSLLEYCLRRLPGSEKDVTVMLSCDGFFWTREYATPGTQCMSVTLHQLVQIVDELLLLGYRVLASTRDNEVKSYMQNKFVGRSIMFTTYIPWEVLAEKSDFVMARDSSIGWQSLAGGKPVLMWSFGNLPSCMEVTLSSLPDYWVGVVRSISDLDTEIAALLARHRAESLRSGIRGVLPPPVINRTNSVLEWISNSNTHSDTCSTKGLIVSE